VSDPHGLGIPVDRLQLSRIEALEVQTHCHATWGRTRDGRWFVDLVDVWGDTVRRYHGTTLHIAVSNALRGGGS
jgi:hypothetical protein